MSGRNGNIASSVHQQYEDHPYPPREPADESRRLIRTYLDTLAVLNHHGFAGKQTFRDGFRVLVAGGGTGDALIHLACQLRRTRAEVHYLDVSQAAMEVARKRARVRALGNITWHHASLLDLPRMGLGPFDYINCIGVLHHLEDPAAGLAALRSVLADGGVMGLMLYGRIGRTGVYQVQELLRRLAPQSPDDPAGLAAAQQVVASLPKTNWFRHSWEWFDDHRSFGEAGVRDLFLHACDRAYTITEVHEFLASAGLRLIACTADERIQIRPEFWLPEGPARQCILRLDVRQREAVGELLCGCITAHNFYASAGQDTAARLEDLDNVPFFLPGNILAPCRADAARILQEAFRRGAGREATLDFGGAKVPLPTDPAAAAFLDLVDDRATTGEILRRIRTERKDARSDGELLAAIRPTWDALGLFDMLLLRHRSVPPLVEGS